MLKTSAAALLAIAMSVGLAHAAGEEHMHMHHGHMHIHPSYARMHMHHGMVHMHVHHGMGHMHHYGWHVIPGCALGQPATGTCACGTAANHRPLLCHQGQWCHPSQACTM